MNDQKNVSVITNLNNNQIEQLVAPYRNAILCSKKKLSAVDKLLTNSNIIISIDNDPYSLVVVVRVLTDSVYKAILFAPIVIS